MNFCHYAKFFFSFSLNEDVLTRTVFLHENVLEKRIKKFIQRCYKERSFYNPWQNYFREEKKKKKFSNLQSSSVSCYTRKLESAWWRMFCFFSWMKPSVDVMGELWGSIHEGQLNSDIFQQCLIWIMLDLLQLKLII